MIEDTSEYAGVVYGIHNGDFNYRYVGKTQQTLIKRFQGHLKEERQGAKRPLYDWMRKHGVENIQVCVIATFDEDTIHLIDEVETFHIAQCRAYIEEKNMNLTTGGEGAPGHKRSLESRLKQSATVKARGPIPHVRSDDHRKRLSLALKGRPVEPTHAVHLSNISGLGHHTRWHTNRGIVKADCGFCG